VKYFLSYCYGKWYIFYDHDKERELNTESFVLVERTGDIRSGNIGSHDLENWREDVLIRQSLYVAILN
jgi:hypothetical protein